MKHSDRRQLDPITIGMAVRIRIEPEFARIGLDGREFAPRFERFAATLALWGAKTNLTAHPDDPDEIVFHIIDSVMPVALARSGKLPQFLQYFEPGRRILDIGSGAGFPGLVLAATTHAEVTLAETRRKRVSFLEAASVEMGIANVKVERHRADEVDLGQDGFDLVTARGVRIDVALMEAASRVLKPGGLLMIYASVDQEIDPAIAATSGLGHPTSPRYDLMHGGSRTERMLACWSRL